MTTTVEATGDVPLVDVLSTAAQLVPSESQASAGSTTSSSSSASAAETVPAELRFLTYNMLIRPPPITYNGNDFKDERIQRFVDAHVGRFDVLALQEVFGLLSGRRERLIRAASEKGLSFSHHSPRPQCFPFPRFLTDGGLVIVSRHPIVEKDSVDFARGINADQLAMKGALYARIELDGVKPGMAPAHVHVFTTHLQADYEKNVHSQSGGNAPNRAVRRAQLRTLLRFIASKVWRDDHPIVVLGDFNIDSRREATDGRDSAEYLDAMELFRTSGFEPCDLLRECHDGMHPVTICDSSELPDGTLASTEPQLTPHNEFHLRRSIDYVFELTRLAPAPDPSSFVIAIDDDGGDDPLAPLQQHSSVWSSCSAGIGPCLIRWALPRFVMHTLGWRWCGVWGAEKKFDSDAPAPVTMSSSSSLMSAAATPALPPAPRPRPAPGKSTVVEKFTIPDERPFKQLSDHYGVSSVWHF